MTIIAVFRTVCYINGKRLIHVAQGLFRAQDFECKTIHAIRSIVLVVFLWHSEHEWQMAICCTYRYTYKYCSCYTYTEIITST